MVRLATKSSKLSSSSAFQESKIGDMTFAQMLKDRRETPDSICSKIEIIELRKGVSSLVSEPVS